MFFLMYLFDFFCEGSFNVPNRQTITSSFYVLANAYSFFFQQASKVYELTSLHNHQQFSS